MEVGGRRKAYWCVRDFDSRLWWQLQVRFSVICSINFFFKLNIFQIFLTGVVFSSDNPCGSSSDHGIFLLIYHIRSVSCCQTTYKYDGICTRTQGYTSVSIE